MKSINNAAAIINAMTIKESADTTAARVEFVKAVKYDAAEAKKKKTKADHQKVSKLTARARARYNKAIQADTFAALLENKGTPAIVNLCHNPYFYAAETIDDKDEVSFAPAPLSLSAFIPYAAEKGVTVSNPDAYAAAVKDAIDLCVVRVAQGIEHQNMDALLSDLEASAAVKALAASPVEHKTVETYLQAALDAICCISGEDGANVYKIKRCDSKYIAKALGTNPLTGNVVNPQDARRYAIMFRVMRRAIAGESYAVEVANKEEKKESK